MLLIRKSLLLSLLICVACGGGTDDVDPNALVIGTVLPVTGSLEYVGQSITPAVDMAVEEINAAGGNLRLIKKDSGTSGNKATSSVRDLLGENVSGILGAASSNVSQAILDQVIAANITMISPSNSSPFFTDYDDNGFYFRTAPSDIFQAILLADMLVDDNNQRVGILYRDEVYGQRLAQQINIELEGMNTEVVFSSGYDPEATDFSSQIRALQEASVDAWVLIAFSEGVEIIQEAIRVGIGPRDIPLYISSGLVTVDLARRVSPDNPSVMNGTQAITIASYPENGESTFRSRFEAYAPRLTDVLYAATGYDATVLFALASLEAQSQNSAEIARRIVGITKDGEKCSLYATCADLIQQGINIDYDGASGPLTFTEVGEPGSATYDIYAYQRNGNLTRLDQIEVGLRQ